MADVQGITVQEVIFFALIWSAAFLATVARSVRDNDSHSVWHCFSFGCTAGFLASGTVAVLVGRDPAGVGGNAWFWIGLAALIGLLGKEQDKLLRFMLSGVLKGFKSALEEADKKNGSNGN